LTELKAGLKGLRIGVIEHFYKEDAAADPGQVRAIEQAVVLLQQLGASVKTVRLSPLPVWTDCNRTIHTSEAYAIHERDIKVRPRFPCRQASTKTACRSPCRSPAAPSASRWSTGSRRRIALRPDLPIADLPLR